MAVMSMISAGAGAKEEVLEQIETMGVKNIYIKAADLTEEQQRKAGEKHSYGLRFDDIDRLAGNDGLSIVNIAAVKELRAVPMGRGREIMPRILSCSASYAEVLNLKVEYGRFFSWQDTGLDKRVCVLGSSLAKKMGKEGSVGQFLRIDESLYKIIGILAEYSVHDSKTTTLSQENFNEILLLPIVNPKRDLNYSAKSNNNSQLSTIIVEVDERSHVARAAKVIARTLEVAHNGVKDYQLIVPLELLVQSVKTQRVFNLVLAVTGGISLLVGGIGIMNVMLATVSERKREIGIRRAVGATERHIIVQFLTESVLLTLTGGLLGLLAGLISAGLIAGITGWTIRITPASMFVPFLLAIGTGVFFGLYPAIKAARLDPIQALRGM
jgi:putative ABC transport system permease protein